MTGRREREPGSQQAPDLGLHLMEGDIKFWMSSEVKAPWNFPLWLFHWGRLGLWAVTIGGDLALESQRSAKYPPPQPPPLP